MNKIMTGVAMALALTAIGITLRLCAHHLAWPSSFSYSGPASETPWGRTELAYCEIARWLMGVGALILTACFTRWLFISPSENPSFPH
ncbi:hypothetical protein BH11VER1_BH11VER1_32410 [soil metagenome]